MDDRAERLRKRRKQSAAKSNGQAEAETEAEFEDASEEDERSEAAESSNSSKPSKPSKRPVEEVSADAVSGQDGEQDEATPVKEQQIGTYMYLPESQVKQLRRQYNVLKAEYEFEYDESFEKNRHFYPLVVEYGLEGLDELDTAEIRDRLKDFY